MVMSRDRSDSINQIKKFEKQNNHLLDTVHEGFQSPKISPLLSSTVVTNLPNMSSYWYGN
jgi:hypothetical protein